MACALRVWQIGAVGVVAVMAMAAAAAAQPTGQSATAAQTVWDGVYTAAQAERGQRQYELHCASCHGPDLRGLEGPALAGAGFLRNWMEDDLQSLFHKLHSRMPADAPASLPEQTSADITAYLLQENGFPAGDVALSPDTEQLAQIRIQREEGPGPVPNFSLVVVAGCLERRGDDEWFVVDATEPVRARDHTPGSVDAAAAGSLEFYLMDARYVGAEALEGQTVLVTGLLIREPEESKLNVTAIEGVGGSCGP